MKDSFPFVQEFLSQFATALPKVLMAFAVLVIGLLLAKIISSIIKKILKTLKVDVLGEKLEEIEIISKSNMEIVPSTVLSKIVYYFLILIFVMFATEILDVAAISNLFSDLINFIPSLLVAIIILFLGLLFAEFIRKAVHTLAKSLNLPSSNIIANAVFYFMLINVLITALKQTGISTSFVEGNFMILIGGGVLAFAIGYGLAAKDLLANFLSSFYIKDRFTVGTKIRVGGSEGEIIDVSKTFITLETSDSTIMIPINKALKEKIEILKK